MLIEIRDCSKTFKAPDGGDAVTVLQDAELEIAQGESVAIVGPSGSGKSTLLNLLGALDQPDSGTVRVGDRNVAELSADAAAAYRNETVGFIFQLHHLLPQCTVLENVLVPTLCCTDAKTLQNRERAETLLISVGLEHRLNHRPAQLSGGERQRVAIARALINRPKVLLADEPTGALDRTNALRLADLLGEINRTQNVTIVMATHSAEIAQRMGRVLELVDGNLVKQ